MMLKLTCKVSFIFLFTLLFISCSASRPDRSYLRNQSITCNNVISASQPWMGTPYKYGGSDLKGVDCSGFVQNIYQQVFAIKLPRTVATMFQQGSFLRGAGLKCGDLIFFKNVRTRGGVDHVGIYVGNNRFVHSSTTQGVVISDLQSAYYQKHFVAARRF